MKKLRFICLLLALCMLLPALSACEKAPERPPETEPDYEQLEVADIEYLTSREFFSTRTAGNVSDELRFAAADFALRLLNESSGSYSGNGLLVSPLSVMLALAMTANGAEGETLTQMEELLAGGMTIDRLNQELYNYTRSLAVTPDAQFHIANSVWFTSHKRFSINRNFVKEIENTYDADIICADLVSPATLKAVNGWVREETNDMIDGILSEGDLNEYTIMVLLNALAFDAVWQDQPLDTSCFDGIFNGDQTVKFMNTECNAYIEGDRETGIVKKYKGGDFAFLALLPKDGMDIGEYMRSLDGKDFLELYDSRKSGGRGVSVSAEIPHFSFECNLDLAEALKRMGMPRAFSGEAEFGALGKSTSGNIFIGKVLHKTHIDLDNSGTRAAAVTAVIMYDGLAPMVETQYRVKLDRSFVYAIIDTDTGLPIFIGACENIE